MTSPLYAESFASMYHEAFVELGSRLEPLNGSIANNLFRKQKNKNLKEALSAEEIEREVLAFKEVVRKSEKDEEWVSLATIGASSATKERIQDCYEKFTRSLTAEKINSFLTEVNALAPGKFSIHF